MSDIWTTAMIARFFGNRFISSVARWAVTIFVLFLFGEIYFRVSQPFLHSTASAGPGSTFRSTNNVDFWVETRTNSLGFPDREPEISFDEDVCRVLFIGDSFVAAEQVPIERKSHILLEKMLNASPSFKKEAQTFALGRNGTGQIEQLSFYDEFADLIKPDIVILVVTSNDFYDNSMVLNSIHTGIHPLHPQNLLAKIDRVTGNLKWYAGEKNYKNYKIKAPVPKDWTYIVKNSSLLLRKYSYFYSWILTNITMQLPDTFEFLVRTPGIKDIYSYRISQIEKIPGYENVFERWNYPEDVSHIDMFFAENMPAVFEEAVSLAGFALDEFLDRKEEDGFELVALLTHTLYRKFNSGTELYGRRMIETGAQRRWLRLLDERGIDAVDEVEFILASGGAVQDAHFSRDGHWSPQGHKWAAEALLSYFEKKGKLC